MEPTAAAERAVAEPAESPDGVTERIAAEHKLDVAHHKPQKGKGRLGSLENPEVYENVPGHVIPILEREFDDFDTEAGKFLDGQTPEDEFIGFRLKQGVYGQRQADVQMFRVKLPIGGDHARADGGVRRRRREVGAAARATSPPARTSRSTTSRCPTWRS